MNTSHLMVALCLFIIPSKQGTTQSGQSGLYMTGDDFLKQKLSFVFDCGGRDKLGLNGLFGSSSGFVLLKGEKHEFDKRKVYGYHSCNNKNYRFYKNDSYQIMDTAGVYIYYRFVSASGPTGKGFVKSDEYYFSVNGNGPILPLKVAGLKEAFANNSKFQYELDAHFKTDQDLLAYDSYLKMYKVKRLLEQSRF